MLRVLPLCLVTGLAAAASTLERAGERERSEPVPYTSSDVSSNDNSFLLTLFFEMTSSTTTGEGGDHPDSAFAGTTAPAARVTDAPAGLDDVYELRWDLGVSAARHDDNLRRWGVDGTAQYGLFGVRLRFDGWRETFQERTILANLFAASVLVGAVADDRAWFADIGLGWTIWHDAIGSEVGYLLTSRFGGRPWHGPVMVVGEASAGDLGFSAYQRYALAVGPVLGAVELLVGYEHVEINRVNLGGPFIRLGGTW